MKGRYRKPGFYLLRSDSKITIGTKKVKTAVRYREDLTRSPNSSVRARLAERNKTIPTHREDATTPPGKKGTKTTPLKTPPSRLYTPNGDELEKDGMLGDLATYSNRAKPKLVSSFAKTMQKLRKADIENVAPPVNGTKKQNLTVTEKSLAEVSKETKDTTRSQDVVMAAPGKNRKLASANQYTKATNTGNEYTFKGTCVRKDNKYEWLHLGGYKLGGKAMQNPLNLVCQTQEMNTWMIPGEQQIAYLAKLFGELTINIEVNTKQINVDGKLTPSHFAVGIIKYEVETKTGFKYKFNVDCKYEAITPHRYYKNYLEHHLDYKTELFQNSPKTPGLKK